MLLVEGLPRSPITFIGDTQTLSQLERLTELTQRNRSQVLRAAVRHFALQHGITEQIDPRGTG